MMLRDVRIGMAARMGKTGKRLVVCGIKRSARVVVLRDTLRVLRIEEWDEAVPAHRIQVYVLPDGNWHNVVEAP